jgi:hypothetical protein
MVLKLVWKSYLVEGLLMKRGEDEGDMVVYDYIAYISWGRSEPAIEHSLVPLTS